MRYVKQIVTGKSTHASILRWAAISVTIAITALCLTLPAFAQTKYVITDGDNVIVYVSKTSNPEQVIEEVGLQLGESDTYTTQAGDGVSEIHINRIQMVTVREGTETMVVGSYGGTVADVLESLDITLSDDDILSCPLDTTTYDGMTIDITRVQTETVVYDEVIHHRVQSFEDPTLETGTEVVVSEGVDGLVHYTAQVTYENGVEVDRQVLSEDMVVAPINTVVLHGKDRSVKAQENSGNTNYRQSETAQLSPLSNFEYSSSTPHDENTNYVPGTSLSYSQVLDFQATAYYSPTSWNTTFTGTEAKIGTVAVDPNFIPLGSKMYIVSADGEYVYGYCTAEDTGGAIKGKIVDLYMNTYDECIQFGRRDVKIYILD